MAGKTIRQRTIGEVEITGGREITLTFRAEGGGEIAAVLQLPDRVRPGTVPGALLLHGFTSRKEVLSETVGRRLVRHGMASLAIDLPLHGSRGGDGDYQSLFREPLQALALWREALAEARLALRYLEARAEVDAGRIGIVGYSLGSHIGAAVAAEEKRIGALVIAAGGDLPTGSPLILLARRVADPIAAVRRYAGRPLLMIHGRHDRTVTPAQAERLYAAAGDPREIRWFDAGHRLPPDAIDSAAEWLQKHL